MIQKEPPENFSPRFEVVSCFVEVSGEVLFLRRQEDKSEGNKWGVPAGKIDAGEDEIQAIAREIWEETGLALPYEQITYFDKVYVRYPDYDFVYHMFHAKLEERPDVTISKVEHQEFCWASPQDSLAMDLIRDEDACIRLFFGI